MNITRVLLLAEYELKNQFITRRAMIALGAFALVWLAMYRYVVYEAVVIINQPDFKELMFGLFGQFGLQELVTWPDAEMAVFWLLALIIYPAFTVFMCNDMLVSDKQRGTLRFFALRVTRLELILGRFFGQMTSLALLMFISYVGAILLVLNRDASLLPDAIGHAVVSYLLLLVNLLPFAALMLMLNTVVRSSRMALVYLTLIYTLGLLILTLLQTKLGLPLFFDYVIPGEPLDEIATLQPNFISGVLWPLAHTALLIAASYGLLKRGDV